MRSKTIIGQIIEFLIKITIYALIISVASAAINKKKQNEIQRND